MRTSPLTPSPRCPGTQARWNGRGSRLIKLQAKRQPADRSRIEQPEDRAFQFVLLEAIRVAEHHDVESILGEGRVFRGVAGPLALVHDFVMAVDAIDADA